MAKYAANLKVPGGKLIKVKLVASENKIDSVQFTGDFFMHPEDALEQLEKHLHGVTLDKDVLLETISVFLKEHDVQTIGCSAEDFSRVVLMAFQKVH